MAQKAARQKWMEPNRDSLTLRILKIHFFLGKRRLRDLKPGLISAKILLAAKKTGLCSFQDIAVRNSILPNLSPL
jgi:hypothetical protein